MVVGGGKGSGGAQVRWKKWRCTRRGKWREGSTCLAQHSTAQHSTAQHDFDIDKGCRRHARHSTQHAQHSRPAQNLNSGGKKQKFDLCCEATLIGGAGAKHDVGASHVPMDDVALMHVCQSRHHFLCCGNDGQHVWLSRQRPVLAKPASLNCILQGAHTHVHTTDKTQESLQSAVVSRPLWGLNISI